ncbi:MAG: Gfo/Idh/MocA family protein [Planctomycetaceae bacterium]
MRPAPIRIERRRFVAAAAALPAACGLSLPAGGAFAAGGERLRVGLVGCGGRGTGAALHALAAAPGVTLVAMADAFADQLASSAAVLEARAAAAFDCPPDRRFAGLDAWRQVVAADVDLVILATPPAFRPRQAAAAVEAGKHVWCEKPGAVDAAGVAILAAAGATAAAAGLCFASGLAERHDPATAAVVGRILDGDAGRPLAVTVRGDLGLPWFRPARPGWTAAEFELRNWISHPRWSGGHLVEHHVAAIDKAFWALGDADPVAAIPDARSGGVRLAFADGRWIEAAFRRRAGAPGLVEERVRCADGTLDLRRPAVAPCGDRHPLRVAMARLVESVRSGRRIDDSTTLCRATLAAVAARTALDAATAVTWSGLHGGTASTARPLQSISS